MDLKIKDVADLLNVSETTIRRWLADNKIPAYRINHQYRFSRIEIEDWVMSHKLEPNHHSKEVLETPSEQQNHPGLAPGNQQFSLFRALHKGGVVHNVKGNTKEEVVRSCSMTIGKKLGLDGEVLTDLLLDREKLTPTALNNGIAIPHARDFLLDSLHDVVTIAFPENPVPYGAMDGQPVHTLFFLFASQDKRHLHLLAKIALLSSQPKALEFLQSQPSKNSLLTYVKDWESKIPPLGGLS